jgi:hypothetical protein
MANESFINDYDMELWVGPYVSNQYSIGSTAKAAAVFSTSRHRGHSVNKIQ